MLKVFMKLLSGGNSRYDWLLLEEARNGKLTVERIDHLLGMKANINCFTLKEPGLDGFTPLAHYVGSLGADLDVVNHLLLRHADIKIKSAHGHTALHLVWYGSRNENMRMRIVERLVENGADPNALDSSGYTPLHNVCANGTHEEVGQLIHLGAIRSLNACGKRYDANPYWGFAPLHTAIFESRRASVSRAPIVELLVDLGANVNLRCNSTRKYTPLELLEEDFRAASSATKREGQNSYTREQSTKWMLDLESIRKILLDKGAG